MATRDELQAQTSEVKAVVARGKRAVKKQQKAGRTHVRGLFAKIAAEEKVSQAQLRQAVKFATTYSTEELKAFLRLRTPSGGPLGISVAYQLMYIVSRRQREAIARLAAQNDWSSRDIKAEVKRRVGVDEKASKGGRRPRLPANSDEAVRQLKEKCDQWQRWVGQLEAMGETSRAQLLGRLRKKVQAVTFAMKNLAIETRKQQ